MRMILLSAVMFLHHCANAETAPEPTPVGLYVKDGVLMKAGQPYCGIGANYFVLFQRVLESPDDKSFETQLPALSKAGIPFVRFMCGGYWPVNQKLYLE